MDSTTIYLVCEKLSLKNVIALKCVSKEFNRQVSQDKIWYMLLFRDFSTKSEQPLNEYQDEYKQLLKRNSFIKQRNTESFASFVIATVEKRWLDDFEIIDLIYKDLGLGEGPISSANFFQKVIDNRKFFWNFCKGNLLWFRDQPNHIKLYISREYWDIIAHICKNLREIYPELSYREIKNMCLHFINRKDEFLELSYLTFNEKAFKQESNKYQSSEKQFNELKNISMDMLDKIKNSITDESIIRMLDSLVLNDQLLDEVKRISESRYDETCKEKSKRQDLLNQLLSLKDEDVKELDLTEYVFFE